MTTTILIGDCREQLVTLPENSIHLCITSPPYYGLRAYSDDPREIGRERTPEQYIDNLVTVFRHVWRVLKNDGVLVLNLGDSYSGSGKGGNPASSPYAGFWGNTDRERAAKVGALHFANVPDKSKLLIPHRVALALQADGWIIRQDLPWVKRNPMPESVTDRPTTAHEYVFLLAKSPRYFWDMDAVRVAAVKGAAGSAFTDGKTGVNGLGRTGQQPRADANTRAYRTSDPFFASLDAVIAEQRAYLAHLEAIRARGGLLCDTDGDPLALPVNTTPYSGAHYAVFPERLIEPFIRAACPVGGTVLDPFGGSGTVGRVAERLNRDCIVIELNADYRALHDDRLNGVQKELL